MFLFFVIVCTVFCSALLEVMAGCQENQLSIASKGALQQKLHTITKEKNITINPVDDQEPIARRTRSRKSTEKL